MDTQFRYLSEADVTECGVLDTASCIDTIEEIFGLLNSGDYLMGGPHGNSHGLGLQFPELSKFPAMPLAGPDRRFVTMPGYVGGRFNVSGNKWYGSNAANRTLGLPRSVLTLILNDPETGEPLALLSANTISASRTGAVPGVAARYLVSNEAASLAVLGCGPINRACVEALLLELPHVRTVTCMDIVPSVSKDLATWISSTFGIESKVVDSVERAVLDADVVTVAASRLAPLEVEATWFREDAVIMLTGPMAADDELWTTSTLVYDHVPLHQEYISEAAASGDSSHFYDGVIGGPLYRLIDEGRLPKLEDSSSLGDFVANPALMVKQGTGRVVFVASGMSVLDIGWGFDLYKRAIQLGVGQMLSLWE
ncbi:tyramine oxidase subunit B [Agreia sp. VKM Ac-1783]|uniref:tyramine oxidase subunit B n=1 Tax=Agreia sp. VKM Ac-1783 TaxID=1938889 RepID=UPI000A2AC988|nr:tyramine oxidase subunit B [Agreia sp. VKM Ac-1783]SMQ74228.1 ornithine cyclodeaminase [Agreia sp. VKM Ac-1783]